MGADSGERILGLDVLRGFALYGVSLTNAFVSVRPMEAAMTAPERGAAWTEVAGWVAFDGLLVMKFVTLFSLLFGMGLVLQSERAAAKGVEGFAPGYLRRLGVLALIGVAHGCLLFEGDILLLYSVVGLVLFLFRGCGPGRLFGLGLVPLGIGIGLTLLWVVTGQDGWSDEMREFDLRAAAARESGTVWEVVAVRAQGFAEWLFVSCLASFNWRVAALFFFGAAIMKLGWTGREHAALHRRAAWWGLGVGGVLEVGAAAVAYGVGGTGGGTGFRFVMALSDELASLLLSAGYFGAVMLVVHGGQLRWLPSGLAAVGRTSLTNYLLQSVLMNVLFMGFGLGLYGEVGRAGVLLLMTGVFGLQIAVSALWLRRFRQGPAEWAWRRLARPAR